MFYSSPLNLVSKKKPRCLFLGHEQNKLFWQEPGYLELYGPMVKSELLGETRSYPYQRTIRWLRSLEIGSLSDRSFLTKEEEEKVNSTLFIELDQIFSEFKPDIVIYSLTWFNEAIDVAVINKIKLLHEFKLFTVIWDYDEGNAGLMQYDRDIISCSDVVAIADSSERVKRIKSKIGKYKNFTNVDSVHFMPMSTDPTVFRPSMALHHDIAMPGSSEGYRVQVYDELISRGYDIKRIGGLTKNDHFLDEYSYAGEMASSKIVINTQTQNERVQLKGRVLQVLSCGSLLLEQKSIESERFLRDLEGLDLMWDSISELCEKIDYWLANESGRKIKANNMMKKYNSRYNNVLWTKNVLNLLR